MQLATTTEAAERPPPFFGKTRDAAPRRRDLSISTWAWANARAPCTRVHSIKKASEALAPDAIVAGAGFEPATSGL